jgi:hypothetical protein
MITIVVGWDKVGGALAIKATAPSGATVSATSAGVDHATGRTWAFLRIKLPHGHDRNGKWTVTVSRTGAMVESGPIHYFVNVIAGGGARLRRWPGRDLHFTGDVLDAVVRLASGAGLPQDAKVNLTVRRPTASAGTLLTKANRPQPPALRKGDTIPSRQSTMLALERALKRPLIDYSEHRFELSKNFAQHPFVTRSSGLYGTSLRDFLNVEGTYTFHAVATWRDGKCTGAREMQWSVEVGVGIDQSKSDVKITPGKKRPDGRTAISVVVVPRDTYGNHVGPGLPAAFTLTGIPGTTLTSAIQDHGDGSYRATGFNDPKIGNPGIVLARPVLCLHKPAIRAGQRKPR